MCSATLENARAIAPGRAPTTTPSFPVLTGTPVAGMAYLDRPSPAGYFIFPDLSVRHEGKYRLSFALYEELKDAKDMDPDDRSTITTPLQNGIDAHVSHRLEVRSSPFVVFSAKKFPGLSESTALSRMVAEQGCRVRIRRDVRMRRRENKSSNDFEYGDEEAAYEQARRTATPDNYVQQPGMAAPGAAMDGSDRPRSVSNASNSSFAPPRRPSMEDMQGYQSNAGYQAMAPPQSTGYSQLSQYGSTQSSYQGQYAPPIQPPAPSMQPPQAPYSQNHQPHNNYQNQSGMSYGYMSNQNYQQPQYEQPAPVRPEPATEYSQPMSEFRRPSVPQSTQQFPGPSQLMAAPYSPMDQYNRSQHQMTQQPQPLQSPRHNPSSSTTTSIHIPSSHAVAPLKTAVPITADRREPVSPSYQSPPNSLSAPMSAASDAPHNHNYLESSRVTDKYMPQPMPHSTLGQKRSFSSTFDTTHMTERLQQGARPNPGAPQYGYDGGYEEADMEEPMDRAAMSYRRADGTHRQRRVPEIGV